MSVSIPSEFSQFVDELVAGGAYPSQSAVVQDALRLLKQRQQRFNELKAEIEIGIREGDRGEASELDVEQFLTELNAEYDAERRS